MTMTNCLRDVLHEFGIPFNKVKILDLPDLHLKL